MLISKRIAVIENVDLDWRQALATVSNFVEGNQ